MNYLISALTGILIGSFPSAFLVSKYIHKVNITEHGTGNAGAMNTYEVTNSVISGIAVFLLDAMKGLLSVVLALFVFGNDFTIAGIALIMAVISHCYNPWLLLKGGRGLATALGGTVIIFPFMPVIWLLFWIVFYPVRKDIIIANSFSTVFTLLVIIALSNYALMYTFPKADSYSGMIFFSISVLGVIFSKHVEPLQKIIDTIYRR